MTEEASDAIGQRVEDLNATLRNTRDLEQRNSDLEQRENSLVNVLQAKSVGGLHLYKYLFLKHIMAAHGLLGRGMLPQSLQGRQGAMFNLGYSLHSVRLFRLA